MSRARRERQARRQAPAGDSIRTEGASPPARSAGPARSPVLRVAEALLWAAVVGLLVMRVAPQLRAAVGWKPGGASEPAVAFAMLDGSAMPLGSLKGRVVLVNFWATWCPPCRAEMPGIETVYEAKREAGFTVVGVSLDDKAPQDVGAFLRAHGIAYPVAMATPQTVAAFGGVSSLPTSFLIDRQGRIRYTVRGMFAGVALRAAVDRLLAERG